MTAVAFPIAPNADVALARPLGRAALQSQAAALSGGAVAFITEPVGPVFATREAALDAYAGRLDDERGGRQVSVQPEDRYCQLRELTATPRRRVRAGKSLAPVYRDGQRWPSPPPPPQVVWRLSISYWRVGVAAEAVLAPPPSPTRRGRAAVADDPETLRRMASEPLRSLKPQQPLDIGLFEFRPPEAPHIIMPDE